MNGCLHFVEVPFNRIRKLHLDGSHPNSLDPKGNGAWSIVWNRLVFQYVAISKLMGHSSPHSFTDASTAFE